MKSTRRADPRAPLSRYTCALLLCAAATLLCACGEETPPPPPDTAEAGTTSGFRWAILSGDASKQFRSDWGPGFRPKTPDVRAAISGVLGALRAEMAREDLPDYVDKKIWREMLSAVLSQVPQYRCQVVGVSGKAGEEEKPFIYLNFVHEKDFEQDEAEEPGSTELWKTSPIVVNDGGDWFWQVKYDPADGTYSDLNINGEA